MRHRFLFAAVGTVALAVAALTPSLATATATPQDTTGTSPLRHDIVFTRFLPGSETGDVYRVAAGHDDSSLHLVRSGVYDFVLLSRDGTQFVDFAPTSDGHGSAEIFKVDGSGDRILPLPDPALDLPGGAWSEGTRRIISQGIDPGDAHRTGLYSRRASDGGDVRRLTNPGDRVDYPVRSAPDGHSLLFFRPDAQGETSESTPLDVYAVTSDGSRLSRLTPKGWTSGVPSSYNSVSWAPDSAHVAIVAAAGSFWANHQRRVHIASTGGSSFMPIGPKGDIWDAVWSPDGRWIAFSMATPKTGVFAMYLMRPDGSSVRRLSPSTDGLSSVHPSWSPASDQLIFLRTNRPSGGPGDLWTVDIDGQNLAQITHHPGGYSDALLVLPTSP